MFELSATRLVNNVRAWRAVPFVFLSFGGLFPQSLVAEEDIAVWLERMVEAAHQLNYTGTFVYQQGGSLQTMQIIHAVDEEGEHERLISLSGPRREVIRDHDKVTCILPEDSSMVLEQPASPRSFPLIEPALLDPLRQHYEFKLHGIDRIAGLKARHIAIIPRDQYRYGQNIWLSEDTGLLLRAEVLDEQGSIVEQIMFTSLEMRDHIPPEMLTPQTENPGKILELGERQESQVSTNGRVRWQVSKLPSGFKQDMERLHYLPNKPEPVEHHLYSDGLASVSVFIEKSDDSVDGFTGSSRMGGVNAYGRRLNGHLATVVGEVPPLTVKLIAESIEAKSEN